ncbi:GH25 family lysozyme [Nocardia sp. NPDC060256]|uniref:GH25 family lysozyme n=1 Tax=unclassified Nocardia TaxID=2637762 RepID=UPI00366169AC
MTACCVVALVGLLPSSTAGADSTVDGMDVSDSTVDWAGVKAKGVAFAYIKATQGRAGTNSAYAGLFGSAPKADLFLGAYHVAAPDEGPGRDQANFFVDHGGAWSASDDKTLPGAVLLQDNPKKPKPDCYGLSPEAMVSWVKEFSNTYDTRTHRRPVIATTTDWWKKCTADSTVFGGSNPLWILHYRESADSLPAGWSLYVFAQYTASGAKPGADRFNGNQSVLEQFAHSVVG